MPSCSAHRPLAAAAPRAAVAASLLVAACASPAGTPPETSEASRVFEDMEPGTAFERAVAALREVGLEVGTADPATGGITAAGRVADRGWADCPRRLTVVEGNDETGNRVVAVPGAYTLVEVRASVGAAPQGARVVVEPAFTAEPPPGPAYVGMGPSEACDSTGVLERLLLRAVATGGAPGAGR